MFTDVPVVQPLLPLDRGAGPARGGQRLRRRQLLPGSPVSREQMAVFVLRTLDPALNPPACTRRRFNDVPATSPFCRWIDELVRPRRRHRLRRRQLLPAGRGDPREQMGVFIAATFSLTLYGP